MSNQTSKVLKVEKAKTYSQVARGVRRVVYNMTPGTKMRDVYKMECKEPLSQYGFDTMDIAETLVKIDMKYNITLPINTFPKYDELTLGKLIYETNCAIQRKKLAPQTNNEVYYILWQILSSKGLKTNIMSRNKPLKEYNIDSLCALALIQDLERKMGLNSCQISKEIEAQFNNATTYNYYNEVSIDDIARIASSKISKPTNEEMFEIELSKFNKKELSAYMNNFCCILK